MKREIRIVLAGGGTGGHIFPLLAVAQELWQYARNNNLNFRLYYLGPLAGPFSPPKEIFLENGVIPKGIHSGSVARQGILGIFGIFVGFWQSLWHLFFIMPDIVFAKGGYGSLPVILARMVYFIPLFIHESDALPGRVNRAAGAPSSIPKPTAKRRFNSSASRPSERYSSSSAVPKAPKP